MILISEEIRPYFESRTEASKGDLRVTVYDGYYVRKYCCMDYNEFDKILEAIEASSLKEKEFWDKFNCKCKENYQAKTSEAH